MLADLSITLRVVRTYRIRATEGKLFFANVHTDSNIAVSLDLCLLSKGDRELSAVCLGLCLKGHVRVYSLYAYMFF